MIGGLAAVASPILVSWPVLRSRTRTSLLLPDVALYASLVPSGDGCGAIRSSSPSVMRRGSPVTAPAGSRLISKRLVLNLVAFPNATRPPSALAEGQKLNPGAMVTGTGAPVTRPLATSNGTRYTLALSGDPIQIITPSAETECGGASSKVASSQAAAPADSSAPSSEMVNQSLRLAPFSVAALESTPRNSSRLPSGSQCARPTTVCLVGSSRGVPPRAGTSMMRLVSGAM